MSQQWILYLNRCVAASATEALEAPGVNTPFFLESILVDLEGGRYVGPILPIQLTDLVSGGGRGGGGAKGNGGKGGGGGGSPAKNRKTRLLGGKRGCRCNPMCTFPTRTFGKGRTRGLSWKGRYSSPCTDMLLVRNGICEVCTGRTVSIKTCTSLPPPIGSDKHFWADKNILGEFT